MLTNFKQLWAPSAPPVSNHWDQVESKHGDCELARPYTTVKLPHPAVVHATQSCTEVLPAGEYGVLGWQGSQTLRLDRNVPYGHTEPAPDVLPDGQKYPAASVDVVQAVQVSTASLPPRNVPAGHADPAPVALPDGQKYPAASVDVVQAVHAPRVASLRGRYVPAGHGVQALTVALSAVR